VWLITAALPLAAVQLLEVEAVEGGGERGVMSPHSHLTWPAPTRCSAFAWFLRRRRAGDCS